MLRGAKHGLITARLGWTNSWTHLPAPSVPASLHSSHRLSIHPLVSVRPSNTSEELQSVDFSALLSRYDAVLKKNAIIDFIIYSPNKWNVIIHFVIYSPNKFNSKSDQGAELWFVSSSSSTSSISANLSGAGQTSAENIDRQLPHRTDSDFGDGQRDKKVTLRITRKEIWFTKV